MLPSDISKYVFRYVVEQRYKLGPWCNFTDSDIKTSPGLLANPLVTYYRENLFNKLANYTKLDYLQMNPSKKVEKYLIGLFDTIVSGSFKYDDIGLFFSNQNPVVFLHVIKNIDKLSKFYSFLSVEISRIKPEQVGDNFNYIINQLSKVKCICRDTWDNKCRDIASLILKCGSVELIKKYDAIKVSELNHNQIADCIATNPNYSQIIKTWPEMSHPLSYGILSNPIEWVRYVDISNYIHLTYLIRNTSSKAIEAFETQLDRLYKYGMVTPGDKAKLLNRLFESNTGKYHERYQIITRLIEKYGLRAEINDIRSPCIFVPDKQKTSKLLNLITRSQFCQ